MTLDNFADLGSVVGIFLVASGLWFSVQQFKLNRTMEYMEYLSNPELVETRAAVDAWLESSNDDNVRLKALEDDHKLHAHIRAFLSFCNQISIAYRYGAIYKKMAFEIWFPFIPRYWEKFEFYILWRHSQGHVIGESFEQFAKDILQFQSKNSGTSRRKQRLY